MGTWVSVGAGMGVVCEYDVCAFLRVFVCECDFVCMHGMSVICVGEPFVCELKETDRDSGIDRERARAKERAHARVNLWLWLRLRLWV